MASGCSTTELVCWEILMTDSRPVWLLLCLSGSSPWTLVEADGTGACGHGAYIRIFVFFFLSSSLVFFLLISLISYFHISVEIPPPPDFPREFSGLTLLSSVLCAPAFQGGLTFRKQRNSCHFNPITSQLLMSKYPGIIFPTASLPVKTLQASLC